MPRVWRTNVAPVSCRLSRWRPRPPRGGRDPYPTDHRAGVKFARASPIAGFCQTRWFAAPAKRVLSSQNLVLRAGWISRLIP